MTRSNDQAYIKRRKRMNFVGAFLTAIVIIALGVYIYIQSQHTNDTPSAESQAVMDRGAPNPGSDYQKPDSGSATRSMSSSDYLNDDGSVDTDAVDNLLNKISKSQYKDQFLQKLSDTFDEDQSDGTISSAQRDALKSAFGIQ